MEMLVLELVIQHPFLLGHLSCPLGALISQRGSPVCEDISCPGV